MKVYDLTHLMENDVPVYPGTDKPTFDNLFTVAKDGFAEKNFNMISHTGTHIDAPAHMIKDGNTLDLLPVDHFAGSAVVIDCSGISNGLIEESHLQKTGIDFNKVDFVLLYTGWSKYWGSENYFVNVPVLSENACKFLTGFNLKGIGVDAISIDPVPCAHYKNHYEVLGKNIIIIENLTNLKELTGKQVRFCCLPLKVKDADGSPVRAVAIVE